MVERKLEAIRDSIQIDIGKRGLRTVPGDNLITACPADFAEACRSIAETANAAVGVVTGFFIPHAQPPCGETDGPLGALFLARALVPLGIKVVLIGDEFCRRALEVGVSACGLARQVPVLTLPVKELPPLTHLIALERAGPSYSLEALRKHSKTTPSSLAEFEKLATPEHWDRCHTMKGRDISAHMQPAHLLFENAPYRTIGIGDGGNEIGMGKIGWNVIHRNIPGGGLVACRIATDYLIVCGVSNWGAYGLAAGVTLLRGRQPTADLFDTERERELLQKMVEEGPLVDGVSGLRTPSVDGLTFDRYIEPLRRIAAIMDET